MNAREAHDQLEHLVGTELGIGDWTALSLDRIRKFAHAVGSPAEPVPAMMLLSLLPGLTSTIELPIEPPRTAVNYGLDTCRLLTPVRAGDRIRARAILVGVVDGSSWLQLKRRVMLENGAGEPVLEAETLTRLFW